VGKIRGDGRYSRLYRAEFHRRKHTVTHRHGVISSIVRALVDSCNPVTHRFKTSFSNFRYKRSLLLRYAREYASSFIHLSLLRQTNSPQGHGIEFDSPKANE